MSNPNLAVSHGDLSSVVPRLRRLVTESYSAADFFQALTELLTEGYTESSAAVWMVNEANELGLFAEHGLTESGWLDDTRKTTEHQQLLLECWRSKKAVSRHVSFSPGRMEQQVLIIPIQKRGQLVGVTERLVPAKTKFDLSEQEIDHCEEITQLIDRFLVQLETASALHQPDSNWKEREAFLRRLHGTLDLVQVQRVVVDELRALLNCDRVTLLDAKGRRPNVQAMSGQKKLQRRSKQLLQLQAIIRIVNRTQQRFQFPHSDAPLPDRLTHQLSEYLQVSGVQMLLVEPIFDQPEVTKTDLESNSRKKSKHTATLVCEQFGDSLPHRKLIENLDVCSMHVGLSLKNSQRYERLRSLPGLSAVSGIWRGMTRSRWAVFALCLLLFSAAGYAMATIKQEFKIACRGHLMPVERQRIFAPLAGEVERVFVVESQIVQAGDPLLQLKSPEIEAQLLQTTSELSEKYKEQDSLRVDLRNAIASQTREKSSQIQARVEIVASQIQTLQKQLQLTKSQKQRLLILAPIAGTVTTADPQLSLVRKPVQRGEPMLELMSESGPWQLELKLPERRAGHLLAESETVEVIYRLAAQPENLWHGSVRNVDDRTELSAEHGTVVNVFCDLDETERPPQRIGMDVSAQVSCGQRSLLYIYVGEVHEYLRRNWWL